VGNLDKPPGAGDVSREVQRASARLATPAFVRYVLDGPRHDESRLRLLVHDAPGQDQAFPRASRAVPPGSALTGAIELEGVEAGKGQLPRIGRPVPGEEMLTLSLRDRDRLSVLRQVDAKLISARRGAELLGLSARQLRRLRRRFEKDGDEAVTHGLRGRMPNNAKPAPVRARALERAGEAVFIDFGPTLLAEHLCRDPEIGPLRADTLRRWLIAAGRWEVRRRGRRHRKARPRREAFGELIQWDSSDHAWFEDRYPGRFVLIKMIDDATNRLLMARFVPTDTGARAVHLPRVRQGRLPGPRHHGEDMAPPGFLPARSLSPRPGSAGIVRRVRCEAC
jgi:hypothetical protein